MAPPGVLGPDELWPVVESVKNEQDRAFLAGLWLTGARTAELCWLQRRDIWEKTPGNWWAAMPVLKRKGVKTDELHPLGKFVRRFPLTPLRRPEEKPYLDLFLSYVLPREGRVFNYNRANDNRRFNGPYDKISRKIDINVPVQGQPFHHRLCLHWVRAWRLAWLCHLTWNPRLVQEWVGHVRLTTTEIYLKFDEEAASRTWEYEARKLQNASLAAPAAPSPPKPEPPERPPEPSPVESPPKPSE